MRVRVEHSLGDLERDLMRAGPEFYRQGRAIVRRCASEGGQIARMYARQASGPHGKNYYKRITWDRSASVFSGFGGGEITAEYGPTGDVVGNAVGAGWRHGPPNHDLEKSQDLIGSIMAGYVRDMLDDIFWAGASAARSERAVVPGLGRWHV